MTKSNQTAIHAAESEVEDDIFRELLHRFVLANERLTLAVHALQRQEDYGPACCVVEEATEALVKNCSDFEGWDMKRKRSRTPKEVQS